MNKNLIIVAVAIILGFMIFKIMKAMKVQSELLKSQSDLLVAVALKTGAVEQKQEKVSKLKSGKKQAAEKVEVVVKENEKEKVQKPAYTEKRLVLSGDQKKVIKLFEDETPKTASNLRELFNKNNGKSLTTKKFNTMLWNLKSRGGLDLEKLEDADSVWGLIEWFDQERLADEYFNRVAQKS